MHIHFHCHEKGRLRTDIYELLINSASFIILLFLITNTQWRWNVFKKNSSNCQRTLPMAWAQAPLMMICFIGKVLGIRWCWYLKCCFDVLNNPSKVTQRLLSLFSLPNVTETKGQIIGPVSYTNSSFHIIQTPWTKPIFPMFLCTTSARKRLQRRYL